MTPDEILSILLSPFNKLNLCGAVFLRFMRANFTGYFILMDAFSVSSAWESTRASHPSVYWWKYVWNKWVHPKIAGFVWRLMHKAISTDERIKSLGFRFPSCCLCCSSPHSKSISNLFVQGELAASLWSFFASHLNISISQAQSLEQRLESWWTDTICSQYSFLRNSVALFILWEVWKDRNSIIHDNVKLNIVKTRQLILKWLLDTVVLFHPADSLMNKSIDENIVFIIK